MMAHARLYWIGLYEAVEPPRWEWFLHVDCAPAIGFASKCFLGGGDSLSITSEFSARVADRTPSSSGIRPLLGNAPVLSVHRRPSPNPFACRQVLHHSHHPEW